MASLSLLRTLKCSCGNLKELEWHLLEWLIRAIYKLRGSPGHRTASIMYVTE